jgi:hypothetical protein
MIAGCPNKKNTRKNTLCGLLKKEQIAGYMAKHADIGQEIFRHSICCLNACSASLSIWSRIGMWCGEKQS